MRKDFEYSVQNKKQLSIYTSTYLAQEVLTHNTRLQHGFLPDFESVSTCPSVSNA